MVLSLQNYHMCQTGSALCFNRIGFRVYVLGMSGRSSATRIAVIQRPQSQVYQLACPESANLTEVVVGPSFLR